MFRPVSGAAGVGDGVDPIYNASRSDHTTFDGPYGMMTSLLGRVPLMVGHAPHDIDSRCGDLRHLPADVSRATTLRGHVPMQRIDNDVQEAMNRHVHDRRTKVYAMIFRVIKKSAEGCRV